MDYINNTLNYLKNTLELIKSAIITTKGIVLSIGNIIGTIIEVLGFIGFRVFLLLITTTFILWLLNLVSPISRKTNYVIAVGLVLWLAVTAKMPIQFVIIKYMLIIVSPLIITCYANFLIGNLSEAFKIISNKFYIIVSKVNFKFLTKKKYVLEDNDNIGLLLTSDLPTLDEMREAKNFIRTLMYNILILEDEKISLVDNDDKIIFLNESKISQFRKSIGLKDIKLLWFWSENYRANELLEELDKTKKIAQNKDIIGGGDNSFILNFLQEKWNWEVIYGQNLKDFIISYQQNKRILSDIIENRICSLTLINDYDIGENYFIKDKIVGSDLFVLMSEIGSGNQLNFKNKILFLDIIVENKKVLYRLINQLQNYILNKNIKLKAVVFGNVVLKDSANPAEIINFFSDSLKNKNMFVPFFKIHNFDFIRLNTQCIIEYRNNKILLSS